MAGRIPETFIDDVLSRTDLVELIDSYVHLNEAEVEAEVLGKAAELF